MCIEANLINWKEPTKKPNLQYDPECVSKIMMSPDFNSFGFATGDLEGIQYTFLLGLNDQRHPLISEEHWAAKPLDMRDIVFENVFSRDQIIT